MAIILNAFPEVPVRETWNWLTDVMTTKRGVESRMSLRGCPRVEINYKYPAMLDEERREFIEFLTTNLNLPSTTPVWPYSSQVTQDSAMGTSKAFFDPTRTQVADGGKLILINPSTMEVYEYDITTMDVDGANLLTTLDVDIDPTWHAVKGLTMLIGNNGGFKFGTVASELQVNLSSWVEDYVQRTGTAASLTIFNSLPILERTVMEGANENFRFQRNVFDNGIGLRTISSRRFHADLTGKRRFLVDRKPNSTDLDYWALLLDTVKGSWKAFLLSSQLKDMTLATALVQAGTTMVINETYADNLFHAFDAYKNFEIKYSDGTFSQHTISTSVEGSGDVTVTFTPALPNDPKVASVVRISYLYKVRMSDQQVWGHTGLESQISFDITTTDQG